MEGRFIGYHKTVHEKDGETDRRLPVAGEDRPGPACGRDAWPPLAGGLVSHAAESYLGFHMPGHHQGRAAWAPWRELLGQAVFDLDLTELPGLDNLQDPRGIIRSAAAEAAAFFGAAETRFLVNGASAGILAVLLAACREGDRVLLPRNCHQSVVHGLVLSGATPVYLPVRWHPGLGLPGLLRTDDLQQALGAVKDLSGPLVAPPERDGCEPPGASGSAPGRQLKKAPQACGHSGAVPAQNLKLLVLLHPNYYGLAGDLAGQIELARRSGLLVLADEAHGAHFRASPLFPTPALQAGADYVVHGAHKTLGAFTQAAMLHCREGVHSEEIARALRLVQTTSPSYLLLASLDVARRQLQQSVERWEETARLGERLRREISRIPGLLAPGEELSDVPGVCAYDPARLIVNVSGLGITGFAAAAWLRRERRILVEMADPVNLVFILSPGDVGPAADALLEGLRALAACGATGSRTGSVRERCGGGNGGYGGYAGACEENIRIGAGGYGGCRGQDLVTGGHGAADLIAIIPDLYELPIPRQALTPRQAFLAPARAVTLEAAAGRIAAEAITPYPPGIPVICPGEVIDAAVLETLKAWRKSGGTWPGCGRPTRPCTGRRVPGTGWGAGTIAVVDGS